MFKRKVKNNRQVSSQQRLDQLMVLMASDEIYEQYLDTRSLLQLEVEL